MVKIKDKTKGNLVIKQEANNTVDMYIYGVIVSDELGDDEVSSTGVRDALQKLGKVQTINLHINSIGGSVFDGIAIYNMLKQNPAHINVYVDALAASIASVIAMAGDTIYMPENSYLMIHYPMTDVNGNAKELRKAADDLDQVGKASIVSYLSKAGDKISEDKLRELMDNETWLTADEALGYGLADKVIEANKAAACLDKKSARAFKNMPKELLKRTKQPKDIEQKAVEKTEGKQTEATEDKNQESNKKDNQAQHLKAIAREATAEGEALDSILHEITNKGVNY